MDYSAADTEKTPYSPTNIPAWLRTFGLIIWLLLWPLVAYCIWSPISFGLLRLTLVIGVLCLWLGALVLFPKIKAIRWLCLGLAIAVVLVLLWPGRNSDSENLRSEYLTALSKYEGTPYVWGGENHRGIDCSGLVRRSWIEANFRVGLQTLNPRLLRRAVETWWFDSSARAIGEEYRNNTVFVTQAASINTLDHQLLEPGDVAITSDGVHALAYLGELVWTEADPKYGRVIQVQVPTDNAWFGQPVKIMRWRQLADVGKPNV